MLKNLESTKLSTDKWIVNVRHTRAHTHKYYLTLKKNVRKTAGKWMDLEYFILEVTHSLSDAESGQYICRQMYRRAQHNTQTRRQERTGIRKGRRLSLGDKLSNERI